MSTRYRLVCMRASERMCVSQYGKAASKIAYLSFGHCCSMDCCAHDQKYATIVIAAAAALTTTPESLLIQCRLGVYVITHTSTYYTALGFEFNPVFTFFSLLFGLVAHSAGFRDLYALLLFTFSLILSFHFECS